MFGPPVITCRLSERWIRKVWEMLSYLMSLSCFLFPSSICPQMIAVPQSTSYHCNTYIQRLFIHDLPWASRWWAKANVATELRQLVGESDVSQIKTQINVKPPHAKSYGRVIHGDSDWGSFEFLWVPTKGWRGVDIFNEVRFSLTFFFFFSRAQRLSNCGSQA